MGATRNLGRYLGVAGPVEATRQNQERHRLGDLMTNEARGEGGLTNSGSALQPLARQLAQASLED